ncbi:MAG: hypothetical protein WCO56_24690 [Verrucomicrobiota bacterium]
MTTLNQSLRQFSEVLTCGHVVGPEGLVEEEVFQTRMKLENGKPDMAKILSGKKIGKPILQKNEPAERWEPKT